MDFVKKKLTDIRNHQTCKEFLTKTEKNFKKSKGYRFIDIFGKNMVSTSGKDWFEQRNIFNPVFSLEEHLRFVFDVSLNFGNVFSNKILSKEVNDFECSKNLKNLTLDVISTVAFGYDLHAVEEKKISEFEKSEIPNGVTMNLKDSLHLSLQGLVFNFLFGETIFSLLPFSRTKQCYNVRDSYFQI